MQLFSTNFRNQELIFAYQAFAIKSEENKKGCPKEGSLF